MAWLDGIYPDSPHDLVCKKENENIIRLDWDIKKSPSNDSIRYYALYSLPHPNSELLPDYLLDIIPADKSSIDLSIKPKQVNYYFTIKSVSKLWNESIESSNIAQIKFDELLSLADFQDMNAKPMLLKESKDNFKILLTSAINNTIIISGGTESKDQIIKSAEVSVGKNIININSDLNNYSKILIKYINSNKEYSLKLR
jgi:hypothetical protein